MKEKVISYLNKEYEDYKRLMETQPYWFNPIENKDRMISRCYGVVMFAQEIGVDYPDIVEIWDKWKIKVDSL
jgi:hypothetical protein